MTTETLRTIPFRAYFREAIVSGRKTATTRTKRYGWPGDRLATPFELTIELTEVGVATPWLVMQDLWREEGCDSPAHFEQVWRSLHRGAFDPMQIVWVHRFRVVSDD